MREFLFEKMVDQSVFKSGLTISVESNEKLKAGIGIPLEKGKQSTVYIKIKDQTYEAGLLLINHSNTKASEVLQIRYGEKSPLGVALKNIFSKSYQVIAERIAEKKKGRIHIKDESIRVYIVGNRTLEFECMTNNAEKQKDIQPITLQDYSPELSKEEWLEILSSDAFLREWKEILAMFYKEKKSITFGSLANKYNRTGSFIRNICLQMAKKVHEESLCPLFTENGIEKYMPVLFQEKEETSPEKEVNISWTLRTELYDALTYFDILQFLPKQLSVREEIERIRGYIASRGFRYETSLIENFYLSLKSKPFVILAGISGTGKTRLVKLFAEAINAEYNLVSVRPDWNDGSDLFGHLDLNGNFLPGPVCDSFEQAIANPNRIVFLCLDEMNLARVEYYMSDFLSVIESRERILEGNIVTSPIAQYKNGIPDNLYIVGTVNMDETTFSFSKKVLDRANTIEFNYVDLMPNFKSTDANVARLWLSNDFLRTKYLVLTMDCTEEQEYVNEICTELQRINSILLKANAHIGYRVRDEIVFYMLNNKADGYLLTHNEALDNEIMQQILPRIQGSTASVRDMLGELFVLCAADYNQKTGDMDSEKMRKILSDDSINCSYRRSAEKLELMVRRFEEDGFTSYWL